MLWKHEEGQSIAAREELSPGAFISSSGRFSEVGHLMGHLPCAFLKGGCADRSAIGQPPEKLTCRSSVHFSTQLMLSSSMMRICAPLCVVLLNDIVEVLYWKLNTVIVLLTYTKEILVLVIY